MEKPLVRDDRHLVIINKCRKIVGRGEKTSTDESMMRISGIAVDKYIFREEKECAREEASTSASPGSISSTSFSL